MNIKENIEKVKIDTLKSPEWNPRNMPETEMNKLKNSITEFGYVEPIIVNQHNNHVVGGNQRLEAMKQLGKTEIEAIIINEPDINREKALNIALNRITGEFNPELLGEALNSIILSDLDVLLTGFENEEIMNYINKDYEIENLRQRKKTEYIEDEAENQEEKDFNIQKGDIYCINDKHFIFCDDSTDTKSRDYLIEKIKETTKNKDIKINCLITSSPYNMDYDLYENNNDNLSEEEYITLLTEAIKNYQGKFNIINLSYNNNTKQYYLKVLYSLQEKTGLKFQDLLIWEKLRAFNMSRYDMMNRLCEHILVLTKNGKTKMNKKNVWNIIKIDYDKIGNFTDGVKGMTPTDTKSKINLAKFPIELADYLINIFYTDVNKKSYIVDCFSGSGTILKSGIKKEIPTILIELDSKQINHLLNELETEYNINITKI